MKYRSKVASRCFTKGFLNCQPFIYKGVYRSYNKSYRSNKGSYPPHSNKAWKEGAHGCWVFNYQFQKPRHG